jgi:hypothetical protein
MKSNFMLGVFVLCILSGCEEKQTKNRNGQLPIDEKRHEIRVEQRPMEERHKAIRNELLFIQRTTNDTTQPDYIRESAVTFEKILGEENDISWDDWSTAHNDMMEQKNETTISTYVSFLKALEKKLPDKLPPIETYQAMKSKTGKADIVEHNVAQAVMMMSNSLQDITRYDDPTADKEVEGVLKRLSEKYGISETGNKILELLNMVHGHGIDERKSEHKPWHTPRRPPVYIPKGEPQHP